MKHSNQKFFIGIVLIAVLSICVGCGSGSSSVNEETLVIPTSDEYKMLSVGYPQYSTAQGDIIFTVGLSDPESAVLSWMLLRSTDNGASFTSLSLPGGGGESLEAILLTPENVFLLAYDNSYGKLNIYRSTDLGESFTQIEVTMEGCGGNSCEYLGDIYLLNESESAPIYLLVNYGAESFFKTSEDGGLTFSENRQMSKPLYSYQFGQNHMIASSSGQYLYVSGEPIMRNINEAAEFTEVMNCEGKQSEGNDNGDMLLSSDGDALYVICSEYSRDTYFFNLFRSYDAGGNFEEPVRIATLSMDSTWHWRLADFEAFGNNLYVFWGRRSWQEQNASQNALFFTKSTDGGQTFEEVTRISDYSVFFGEGSFSAIIDNSGKLFVFMRDCNLAGQC